MVRLWADIRKIREPIDTKELDSGIQDPDTIAATTAEDSVDYSGDPKDGVTVQNLGPDPVKIRFNGTAALAAGSFHALLPKNSMAVVSGIVTKVSAITPTGTAELAITTTESP